MTLHVTKSSILYSSETVCSHSNYGLGSIYQGPTLGPKEGNPPRCRRKGRWFCYDQVLVLFGVGLGVTLTCMGVHPPVSSLFMSPKSFCLAHTIWLLCVGTEVFMWQIATVSLNDLA
ncbi:hypothetical protein VNO77_08891 [Canavalia gladiata]|uniref:Uncharacterized protein n=1 Tax=Canavalia gladiata TaxID=3824 RepID=A0AAN9QWS1_CANGL